MIRRLGSRSWFVIVIVSVSVIVAAAAAAAVDAVDAGIVVGNVAVDFAAGAPAAAAPARNQHNFGFLFGPLQISSFSSSSPFASASVAAAAAAAASAVVALPSSATFPTESAAASV